MRAFPRELGSGRWSRRVQLGFLPDGLTILFGFHMTFLF